MVNHSCLKHQAKASDSKSTCGAERPVEGRGARGSSGSLLSEEAALGERGVIADVATELGRREHVGWLSDEVERWHERAVEPVELEGLDALNSVDLDSPAGIEDLLIVERDDVGDGCAWVLDLNATVGGPRVEDERSVAAKGVRAVLPEDDGGNAVRKGSIGCEAILRLLEEAVVGERVRDT